MSYQTRLPARTKVCAGLELKSSHEGALAARFNDLRATDGKTFAAFHGELNLVPCGTIFHDTDSQLVIESLISE